MMLLGLADHFVAEHDPYLFVGALAAHRFEPGLFGSVGSGPLYVSLHPGHEEEQPDDPEGPHDQDSEKEQLIRSHTP